MNVIQFPTIKQTNSPAYNNLVQFFDVCKSPESCQFYLDVVEISYDNGGLNDSELFTLRLHKSGFIRSATIFVSENL